MKIVNVIGGLGNQMFQYAFAIALKNEFPDEEVKLNTLCFNGYPLHNGFELDKLFEIKLPYATLKDLLRYSYPWTHYRLWQFGTHFLPMRKSMTHSKLFNQIFSFDEIAHKSYFDGYWQSPKYFSEYKNEITKALKFPKISDEKNREIVNFINQSKTAFLHVRRGDYVNHPVFGGICTEEYYRKAVSILMNEYGYKQFVVFSNDIVWCTENLPHLLNNSDIRLVTWNVKSDSFRDMQLMSMCKAGVIANSSFSWWGAWLGDMEIVICPDRWTNTPGHHDDILPREWYRIRL